MAVTVGNPFKINYLDEENLKAFCDVQIISSENDSFYINRIVLASHSYLFVQILSELSVDPLSGFDEISISTNISTKDLIVILDFLVKGTIQVQSGQINDTSSDSCVDPRLSECFHAFGIPLKELKLTLNSDLIKFDPFEIDEVDDFADFREPDFESDKEELPKQQEPPEQPQQPQKQEIEIPPKLKRGRPKNGEKRVKYVRKVESKLHSAPFADEAEDIDALTPKQYRGQNFKIPHINVFRWMFLPTFVKETMFCELNGLPAPQRRKKKTKPKVIRTEEDENAEPEEPIIGTKSLRDRSKRLNLAEKSVTLPDDEDGMADEPVKDAVDSDFSVDEDEAEALQEQDEIVYVSRPVVGNGDDLTPVRRVPRRRQGPRAGVLFYFPTEGKRDESKKYQCTKCIQGFESAASLEQHILRHDSLNVSEAWYCLSCQPKKVVFQHVQDLYRHRLAAHKNTHVVCPYCDKKFKGVHASRYKRHLREHKKPSMEYVCASCGAKFFDKGKWKSHMYTLGPFHKGQCATCKQDVASWKEHQDHVNQEHGGVFMHACGLCNRAFKSVAQMQVHRRSICIPGIRESKQNLEKTEKEEENDDDDADFEEKPKKKKRKKSAAVSTSKMCEQCGKTFASESNYALHHEDHHGPDQLQCPKCPKILKHPLSLERHVKRMHETFPCEHCGIEMTNGKYPGHVFTHHTPDELKPFICEHCNKGFGSRASFKEHNNTHTSLRPYKCKQCSATFNSAGNLYAHIRGLHKGIKREKKPRNVEKSV